MKHLSYFLTLSLSFFTLVNLQGQEVKRLEVSQQFGETITTDELYKHLSTIASDEYQGRETGQEGQRMAAEYIAKHFEDLKFTPGNPKDGTFYQAVPLRQGNWDNPRIQIGDKEYTFKKDFYGFSSSANQLITKKSKLVFAGYGIDDPEYSDYDNKKVKDKILVIFDGEPKDKDGNYLVTKSTTTSDWTDNWRLKLEVAKKKGVKALLVVDPDLKKNVARFGPYLGGGGMKLQDGGAGSFANTFYISEDMFNDLFPNEKVENCLTQIQAAQSPKALKSKKKAQFTIKKNERKFNSENVLGFLEGTDLKDEILVITSHYDHLGVKGDKIFNGADDDGSGTVALLELADAFAQAKAAGNGPRRSLLFMTVTGEEKGLLGSEFYVTNPLYPLEKTIVNLNIDMVGRTDDLHTAEDNNYVYIIGSDRLSTELHEINEAANKKHVNMTLDYKYNDPEDPNRFYYRSDHYNFAKNNIPIIFYFNGTHEDYHKETDTVDKIEFDILAKRAKLVFYTAWQLANQDKRIEVDVMSGE